MKLTNSIMIATILTIAAAVSAYAGIVVTPDRHIVKLSPGKESMVEYRVYNSGTEKIEVELDPKAWGKTKEIDSWLSLPETVFTVEPGKEETFKMALAAPKGKEGELIAMVFLCYKEDPRSILNIRNGFPVYLIIDGTENYDISVLDAGVTYTNNDLRNALDISVEVENVGNVHINPDIRTRLMDSKGKVIREFFSEDSKILLSKDTHAYKYAWLNPILSNGNYIINIEMSDENLDSNLEHQVEFRVEDGKIKTEEVKPKE